MFMGDISTLKRSFSHLQTQNTNLRAEITFKKVVYSYKYLKMCNVFVFWYTNIFHTLVVISHKIIKRFRSGTDTVPHGGVPQQSLQLYSGIVGGACLLFLASKVEHDVIELPSNGTS